LPLLKKFILNNNNMAATDNQNMKTNFLAVTYENVKYVDIYTKPDVAPVRYECTLAKAKFLFTWDGPRRNPAANDELDEKGLRVNVFASLTDGAPESRLEFVAQSPLTGEPSQIWFDKNNTELWLTRTIYGASEANAIVSRTVQIMAKQDTQPQTPTHMMILEHLKKDFNIHRVPRPPNYIEPRAS
jgi:hypothetical protein